MAINENKSNLPLIAAVVAGVLVVGGLGFFAGKASDGGLDLGFGSKKAASSQYAAMSEEEGEPITIKPGNPVVAKVGDNEVTRADVLGFIQTLPPQTRQMPLNRVFPVALEQVITSYVINTKAKGVNLDSDPRVKAQLDRVKQNIVREVFLQNKVEEKLTDERVHEAYEAYAANFPKIDEVRVRHILLEDKAKAQEVLKKLKDGADFAELAAEYSIDNTAQNGGEVGYFAKNEVVPEFGEAAFAAEVGALVAKPVKTEFGYHIMEVTEKRQRPPATLEQVKPMLEAQLRKILLSETIQEWKAQADVERFDINGDAFDTPAKAEDKQEG